MSVPVYRRTESKFAVALKARDLYAHTMQVCSNSNVFKPEYNDMITKHMVVLASKISYGTFIANKRYYPYSHDPETGKMSLNKAKWEQRRKLQNEALNACYELDCDIQVAAKIFHIRVSRIEYWIKLLDEVRTMLEAWIDSDNRTKKEIGT